MTGRNTSTLRVVPPDVLGRFAATCTAHAQTQPDPVIAATLAYGYALCVESIRLTAIVSVDPLCLSVPATRWRDPDTDSRRLAIAIDERTPEWLGVALRERLRRAPRGDGELLRGRPGQPVTARRVQAEVTRFFADTVGYPLTPAALVAASLAETDQLARYAVALDAGYAPSMALRLANAHIEPRLLRRTR